MRLLRRGLVATAAALLVWPLTASIGAATVSSASGSAWPSDVFAVGSYHGVAGQFGRDAHPTVADIQAAVDAAKTWAERHSHGGHTPTTFVLLAPGDYKTVPSKVPAAPRGQDPAGVLITEANTWLVGMNRDKVIVDGTKSGAPCSTRTADQVFGTSKLPHVGLNGVMVWKAAGTWVENLTVCNFLDGTGGDGGAGNEIWWNGGADTGKVFVDHLGGYVGEYLTATSTYFDAAASDPEATAATYGIFSSNWDGGVWNQTYASNFNDSGYYIGACQDECNQEVDHAWAEYNALGYSGSNSGGWLLVEHSRFDHNEDGFDTNSQNGDNPPPQNGSCPRGVSPPVAGASTCWVFYKNVSTDNNDPNVPTYGSAAAGPVGTGMSLSGARDDTVLDNTFSGNGAWGTILVPYPTSGDPCSGGTLAPPDMPSTPVSGEECWFDEYGDALIGNTYSGNGFFGNPTNGDIGAANAEPGPTDCFSKNTDAHGLSTSPPDAETLYPRCDGSTVPPDANAVFVDEVACDSGSIALAGSATGSDLCAPGTSYPRQTRVVMHPLPGAKGLSQPSTTTLPTMPDPCQTVPANPWCPAHHSTGAKASPSATSANGARAPTPSSPVPPSISSRTPALASPARRPDVQPAGAVQF